MGLIIGPGLDQWCRDHQATPLANETYCPPDYQRSALPVLIADSQGQTVMTLIGWDKVTGQVIEPGPGLPVTAPAPLPTPGGLAIGFDVGFPPDAAAVIDVVKAMGATFCAVYIGGPDYAGTWTPDMARQVQDATGVGFIPIWVPRQAGWGPEQAIVDAQAIVDLLDGPWRFSVAGNLFIDVEANSWFGQAESVKMYCNELMQLLTDNESLWGPGVYGPRGCCDFFKANPSCATWLANWDGVSDVEGYDLHQYHGSIPVAGLGVDLDVAILRPPAFQLAKL